MKVKLEAELRSFHGQIENKIIPGRTLFYANPLDLASIGGFCNNC